MQLVENLPIKGKLFIGDMDNSWQFDSSILTFLSPYEKEVVDTELARPLNYYSRRLRAIEFRGQGKVLDAACGIGQWSIALATLNHFVEGIDISSTRLFVAEHLREAMNIKNVRFQWGNMHKLPFEDASFDIIFCYVALMYGHIPKILSEFYRVLKKDGKIYVNISNYGYYLHLLIERGIKARNLALCKMALRSIERGFIGKKSNIPVTKRRLKVLLRKAGFTMVHLGADGSFCCGDNYELKPIYPPSYYGLSGVLECIAVKNG